MTMLLGILVFLAVSAAQASCRVQVKGGDDVYSAALITRLSQANITVVDEQVPADLGIEFDWKLIVKTNPGPSHSEFNPAAPDNAVVDRTQVRIFRDGVKVSETALPDRTEDQFYGDGERAVSAEDPNGEVSRDFKALRILIAAQGCSRG